MTQIKELSNAQSQTALKELLTLREVSVYVGTECLLEPISLQLERGRPITILGQTGAGKSLLAQAVMGLLPSELRVEGDIKVFGKNLSEAERRELWGKELVMLPQEPWNALDPLMKAESQVSEVYRYVHNKIRSQAQQLAHEDLAYVGLAASMDKRPGELSGGMAQRLAIAAVTAGGASLILADEPTKGLDSGRREDIVRLLQDRSQQGSLLTITHDVSIARQLGGEILVIKSGRLIERGEAEQILNEPQHAYTQALVNAEPLFTQLPPRLSEQSNAPATNKPILTIENVMIERGGQNLFPPLSFTVNQGEITWLVGESGRGKSSLGDALLGLVSIASGSISRKIENTKSHQWLKLYQDPPSAFTSSVTLGVLLDDLVALHKIDRDRIPPLMMKLGLKEALLARNCNGVSGGELQRFAILRALLLDPVFLFADEPTSRLDPITAQEVMTLLRDVAKETNCAVLLVSHDTSVVGEGYDQLIAL